MPDFIKYANHLDGSSIKISVNPPEEIKDVTFTADSLLNVGFFNETSFNTTITVLDTS